jgi:hypothetical protein
MTLSELQEILWDYSEWLHKKGYIDTDFYTEEPYAVNEYLKETKYDTKKIPCKL